MLFYRLKRGYCLRGWEKLTCVLVKRPGNRVRALEQDVFQCLMLCDGETESEVFPEAYLPVLKEYEREGIVEASELPQPLEKDQYYRYYKNRYVSSAFWSVTGRCNYRCRHCFMDAPEGTLGEITTEQALDFIDQMADCGILRVEITGGEPFVRKDFWQLADRLVSYQITIGKIYSNGWLLNDAVLDSFEQRGLKPQFSISFDGTGWHDWMRGVEGAEQAALRALRLCHARGFPTDVEMCVHRGNIDKIAETVEVLRSAGVGFLKIGSVSPTALWLRNSGGNEISEEEFVEAALRYIPQYFEAGRPFDIIVNNVIELFGSGSERAYSVIAESYDGTDACLNYCLCQAARNHCYITPEGRLLPYMPMTACQEQRGFPLIQEIGLREGLSGSVYMEFVDRRLRDLFAVNQKCAACPYRLKCGGGCRAKALENGDIMGADPTQCMLWEKGYVEKIHRAADEAIARYGK